jgi:hypothetical protein
VRTQSPYSARHGTPQPTLEARASGAWPYAPSGGAAAAWPEAGSEQRGLADADADPAAAAADGWGWAEVFIAIQLLLGALLFLPGMQAYRGIIRALPYLTGGAALIYYFHRATGERLHPSAKWLLASLALLGANLVHPSSHLMAGVAQVVFQATIAAPAFWMSRAVRSEARLHRVMWMFFLGSFLGSAVGILQVYWPERFLPPEFSALGQSLNPDIIGALTYRGADGRDIIRPPGLTDLPGGAAVSGMMTMILGLALAMRPQAWWRSAACLAAGAIGMTALYLTQVRSLAIVAALSAAFFAAVKFRQGRVREGAMTLVAGAAIVVGGYLWAVTVGGDSLSERFSGIVNEGVLTTYSENRGIFLRYTLFELLYEFPFGAGVGRWGMMHVYFGDPSLWQARAIHVEIQPTGWLLDGGVPMWFAYGGAIVVALLFSYRCAVHLASACLQDSATMALCLQLAIVGLCFTGAAFNTQLGVQFWAITGALFGAVRAFHEQGDEASDLGADHG